MRGEQRKMLNGNAFSLLTSRFLHRLHSVRSSRRPCDPPASPPRPACSRRSCRFRRRIRPGGHRTRTFPPAAAASSSGPRFPAAPQISMGSRSASPSTGLGGEIRRPMGVRCHVLTANTSIAGTKTDEPDQGRRAPPARSPETSGRPHIPAGSAKPASARRAKAEKNHPAAARARRHRESQVVMPIPAIRSSDGSSRSCLQIRL